MKTNFTIITLLGLVLQLVQVPSRANATTAQQAVVGYGSSDAVLPVKNQELFFMGFDLGLQKTLKDKSMSQILAVEQVANGSQLGAIESANRLINKGVNMLVGFPTSHEALLAAEVAKKSGVLAIFAGAGHSNLAKIGPTVFTTGESMAYGAGKMADFIKLKFSGKKGLSIVNPFAVFSKDLDDTLTKSLTDPKYSKVSVAHVSLDKDHKLSPNELQALRKKQFDYIIMTPYADESIAALEQFEQAGIDLPIVANSSWTTGDVELIRRFLTNRKAPSYLANLWLRGSPESTEFEAATSSRYGRQPTAEMAYGYDLGVIAGKVLNDAKGKFDRESLLASFKRIHCFDSLSSGRMCFDPNGGHALRSISFVQFTKSGFQLVKGAE
jgi:ABC-type branched-subunit amino acid transport system substrate-binding protein